MIKIIYEEPAYYYPNVDMGQLYDMKTEMTLAKDIDAGEAIKTFMKLLNIATFRVSIRTLEDLVQYLKEEGYADDERII